MENTRYFANTNTNTDNIVHVWCPHLVSSKCVMCERFEHDSPVRIENRMKALLLLGLRTQSGLWEWEQHSTRNCLIRVSK